MDRRVAGLCVGLLLSTGGPLLGSPAETRRPLPGAVYAMTNDPTANAVVVWARAADGRLALAGAHPTGGRGSGGTIDPLVSQDSLRLSDDRRWLLAVDAGSDELAVFAVAGSALSLVAHRPAGCARPVSVAQRGERVWVLCTGGGGALAGFALDPAGELTPLASGVRALDPPPAGETGRGPSQVEVTPDGRALVVVDRARSELLVLPLDSDDFPGDPAVVSPSAGRLPFALRFVAGGYALVVEIFGRSTSDDPGGASAASTYRLHADGHLEPITASLPTGETALCWVAAWRSFAWGTNTGSDSLTAFRVNKRGQLSLRKGSVAHAWSDGTPRVPLDVALAAEGRYLYSLDVGNGTIGAFRVEPDGRLTLLQEAAGLAPLRGAQGIAAW